MAFHYRIVAEAVVMSTTLAPKRRRENDSDDDDYLQKLAAEIEYATLAVSAVVVCATSLPFWFEAFLMFATCCQSTPTSNGQICQQG